MRKRILAMLAALAAAFVLTGSMAVSPVSAAPDNAAAAAAYTISIETRDTDLCPCYLSDSWDGTYFEHDAGGVAVKLSVYTSSGQLAGKAEFHPYGEYFYLYDTLSDGVTIYGEVAGQGYDSNGGTPYDLDYVEGREVYVGIAASNGAHNGVWATA